MNAMQLVTDSEETDHHLPTNRIPKLPCGQHEIGTDFRGSQRQSGGDTETIQPWNGQFQWASDSDSDISETMNSESDGERYLEIKEPAGILTCWRSSPDTEIAGSRDQQLEKT